MDEIKTDPTGFSTALEVHYDQDVDFFFHKIELADRIILNIQINGVMDTTFDIPISSRTTINQAISGTMNIEDAGVEPRLLVGNHANFKILIVASQIGKLIALGQTPKDTILSIGSKWFGRGDEVGDDDFDKLMFVLGNVKKILN